MKKNKRNKITSLLLAAVMLIGLWQPMGNVKAEEDLLTGTELLAHYEFTDGGTDSSGNNNHAVIGNGVTVANGVASLPGGGVYMNNTNKNNYHHQPQTRKHMATFLQLTRFSFLNEKLMRKQAEYHPGLTRIR